MRATEIFVEDVPLIGKVPMCFVIPKVSSQYNDLAKLIQNHGGRLTDLHECFTYQIEPLENRPKESAYFKGKVYKANWLVDSVKEGTLLSPEEYLAFEVKKGGLDISFSKTNLAYTITEASKILTLALANKS